MRVEMKIAAIKVALIFIGYSPRGSHVLQAERGDKVRYRFTDDNRILREKWHPELEAWHLQKEIDVPLMYEKELEVYVENGYLCRRDYLAQLAEQYDANVVKELSSLLGPSEDFDGLVSALEDYDAAI
jgi:hypothetical protein